MTRTALLLALLLPACDDSGSSTALADDAAPPDAVVDLGADRGTEIDAAPEADRGSPDARSADAEPVEDAAPEDAMPDAAPVDLGPDAAVDPLARCADELVPAPSWPEADAEAEWAGRVELGQTHVVRTDEDRLAPSPTAERATLVYFRPDPPLESDAPVHLRALEDGEELGVLTMQAGPPPMLEAQLTDAPLPPFAEGGWHAHLPWSWVQEGVTVEIGRVEDGSRALHAFTLQQLGPPHRLTINRSKIVLFGEPDFDTRTEPTEKILYDFFASVPVAEMRWFDSSPWRLDRFVVMTADGPRMADSEASRLQITNQEHHWFILKNQFTLRLSTANTGRGLFVIDPGAGDNSPYSYGTSVGQGWFRTPEGNYRDIDDAPWAAGWTGWTAMWTNACGNGFIHELGHSFTLQHFVGGTAERWGIADEYPDDGTQTADQPWGYDPNRRMLRTWYRVNSEGPVEGGDGLVGKRDPMNGGEPANAATCFPPYTSYHAQRVQGWTAETPTLMVRDGEPGLFAWDAEARDYVPAELDPNHQWPLAMDVPVVTLIGTLGGPPEINQIHPALFMPGGNVFDLPDPFGEGLEGFAGARHYLEIEYADGSREHALIASGLVDDPNLRVFSLNLDATAEPTRVHLWRSENAYPGIVPEAGERLFTREIDALAEELAAPLRIGRGHLANNGLNLTARCTPDVDCATRGRESTWRVAEAPLHVGDPTQLCAEPGAGTRLELVAEGPDGPTPITVIAQRVVRSGGQELRVPIDDVTAWFSAPDTEQSLRAWLPHGPNADLAPGRYRGRRVLDARLGDAAFVPVPITVDLEVLPTTRVDLAMEWIGPAVDTPGSSKYFLVRDPSIGPTSRVWWGDDQATPLAVPMIDDEGEGAVVRVLAWNEICGGARVTFNAGRGANDCPHRAVLRLDPDAALALAGRRLRTPPSSPLLIDARRWHQPNGEALLATFALDLVVDLRDR